MNEITLNVGGIIYKTFTTTLFQEENYFTGIVKRDYEKNPEKEIFIDRDGKHFRLILNFLRDKTVIVPTKIETRKELLIECNFYCLNSLEESKI